MVKDLGILFQIKSGSDPSESPDPDTTKVYPDPDQLLWLNHTFLPLQRVMVCTAWMVSVWLPQCRVVSLYFIQLGLKIL